MNAVAADIVRTFQGSWPAWLPPALPDGASEPASGHLLSAEVTAALAGQSSALPFFTSGGKEVSWASIAPSARDLLAYLSDLRAWIVPSLGWEHPQGLIVTQAQAASLGERMLSLSPGGYLRWVSKSDRDVVTLIVARLRRARELAAAAPPHADDSAPALLDIRQQLASALAAGDRIAADEVLDLLDRLQLDTAQNALLMRLRVWDHFGDAKAVVEFRELGQLLRLRLPTSAVLAIVRAFYRYYLASHEEAGTMEEAKSAYGASVGPFLGSLLSAIRPEHGLEARRILGYRADHTSDASTSRALSHEFPDDPVLTFLAPPGPSALPEPPPVSEEDQFYAAWRVQDWAEVQRVGRGLLPTHPHLASVLERSLTVHPNPELSRELEATAPKEGPPPSPQSWAEWFGALVAGDEQEVERFLRARDESVASDLPLSELGPLLERLAESLTAPSGTYSQARVRLLVTGLAELIGESVFAPGFPAPSHLDLYLLLAQCWGEWKRGSAYPPDGQVLLELADAVLQLNPGKESALAELVEGWWKARPARALLPFMLASVELFHRLGAPGNAERLWILAGEFVRLRSHLLTPAERHLWRKVGGDIGYDGATLDEYVPASAPGITEDDPIRAAAFTKIAVVSTREEQAVRAAELLRERSGAEVVVVTATSGGYETRSASTADVIAYVWSASTHAVYRALDKIDRRKIAYVRGTGTASIVMAVERWAYENSTATGDG